MSRLIIDENDDELHQVLQLAQTLPIAELNKALPGVGDLVGYISELAIRLRQLRHYAKFESTTHKGDQWVRASEVLRIIDEG